MKEARASATSTRAAPRLASHRLTQRASDSLSRAAQNAELRQHSLIRCEPKGVACAVTQVQEFNQCSYFLTVVASGK